MLKRKIYDRLLEWKNKNRKKCLVIKGARQVGKTYIVDIFGKNEYENYVYVNFILDPRLKTAFEGSLEVQEILLNLSAMVESARFVPQKTLIFLDEIQECPLARTSLKSFTLDGRYDVIASGSLLGVHYRSPPEASIPVGYEEELTMHSLDFEEFLIAKGMNETVIDAVKTRIGSKSALGQSIRSVLEDSYRQFMIVGGMPESVLTFISEKNYRAVWECNRSILSSYMDDIDRYTTGSDRNKTRTCLESISMQLAKPNNKFIYADIDGDSKNGSRKYEGNLRWLIDAGIVVPCYNLHELKIPLEGSSNPSSFKIYMGDTGLLLASYSFDLIQGLISEQRDVKLGYIVENCINASLLREGKKTYYLEKKSKMELDFVCYIDGGIAAIEVKSGGNRTSRSLDNLEKHEQHADVKLKLENADVFIDDSGVIHMPLFAAAFISYLDNKTRQTGS